MSQQPAPAVLCRVRPRNGSARCDLPAGHPGPHSAPLAIGGRAAYRDQDANPTDVIRRPQRAGEGAGA